LGRFECQGAHAGAGAAQKVNSPSSAVRHQQQLKVILLK